MADQSQEEKLARAAAALARAEGVTAARETPPSSDDTASGPSASGPARRRGAARARGRSTPLPEDPQSVRADADPEAVARAIVLRQLGMAPRSRAQLEKKLRERGCDDEVAKRVLDRMTEVGLIDDEAYAEMLVRSKQASRGLARRALAHELRKHGIDDDLAEEALGEVGAAQERAKAEELVAKKLRTMHGLSPDVQARRLAGMLARKGYPGDIAWPVVRDAVNDSVERHRD
jgi:regulatory protein